jgi:hypothetical protein
VQLKRKLTTLNQLVKVGLSALIQDEATAVGDKVNEGAERSQLLKLFTGRAAFDGVSTEAEDAGERAQQYEKENQSDCLLFASLLGITTAVHGMMLTNSIPESAKAKYDVLWPKIRSVANTVDVRLNGHDSDKERCEEFDAVRTDMSELDHGPVATCLGKSAPKFNSCGPTAGQFAYVHYVCLKTLGAFGAEKKGIVKTTVPESEKCTAMVAMLQDTWAGKKHEPYA